MAESKVRVKTSDENIIEVDLDVAKQWGPIYNMYEVFGTINTDENPVELENINTEVLNKIIEWSIQHKQDGFIPSSENKSQKRITDISEWDKKFFEVKQEMLFEIIMAANYLGMTVLLDMACKTVADMIRGKTPEQVRQTFNIENDLPPFNPPELPKIEN